MYSTSVYLFTPRQIVVVFSGNSPRRYQLVYAKNLKLNKGVDNQLQFQFLNQEQKPIDLTGKDITFRLISYDGKTILLQKSVTITLALTGITTILVTSGDLEDIDSQACSYSLEITDNGINLPVFVNSEAGARGTIQIVDSVFPEHISAIDVTIPSHSIPNANVVTYYSSVVSTADSDTFTIQPFMDNYSGNIQIQGSTLPDFSEPYLINSPYTYMNTTGSDGYVLNGFHPYLRLEFVSSQGNITEILAR